MERLVGNRLGTAQPSTAPYAQSPYPTWEFCPSSCIAALNRLSVTRTQPPAHRNSASSGGHLRSAPDLGCHTVRTALRSVQKNQGPRSEANWFQRPAVLPCGAGSCRNFVSFAECGPTSMHLSTALAMRFRSGTVTCGSISALFPFFEEMKKWYQIIHDA